MSNLIVAGVIGGSLLAGAIVIIPTVKMAIDMAPFIYANTRASARSGMILDKKKYSELVSSGSFKEMLVLLEDSYYSGLVEHGRDFTTLSKLLDEDLYSTFKWMENIVPKKLIGVIKAINQKFEIADIKSALNSIKRGEAVPELEHIRSETLKLSLQSAKDIQSGNTTTRSRKLSCRI